MRFLTLFTLLGRPLPRPRGSFVVKVNPRGPIFRGRPEVGNGPLLLGAGPFILRAKIPPLRTSFEKVHSSLYFPSFGFESPVRATPFSFWLLSHRLRRSFLSPAPATFFHPRTFPIFANGACGLETSLICHLRDPERSSTPELAELYPPNPPPPPPLLCLSGQ